MERVLVMILGEFCNFAGELDIRIRRKFLLNITPSLRVRGSDCRRTSKTDHFTQFNILIAAIDTIRSTCGSHLRYPFVHISQRKTHLLRLAWMRLVYRECIVYSIQPGHLIAATARVRHYRIEWPFGTIRWSNNRVPETLPCPRLFGIRRSPHRGFPCDHILRRPQVSLSISRTLNLLISGTIDMERRTCYGIFLFVV
jgi:hypothetical protein